MRRSGRKRKRQKPELALANARADAFAKLQTTANRLAPDQITAFLGMGGSFIGVGFTQPEPLNFSDHEGYIRCSTASLKGWNGIQVLACGSRGHRGRIYPQNPSGNSYLVYRDVQAKDLR